MNHEDLNKNKEENDLDHYSKKADELILKNANKGLFILQYFTCKNCGDIPEDEGKRVDVLNKVIDSNQGLSGFSIGWTEKGLQVWCETCDSNVINLDFKGQKVGFVR